MTGFSSWGVPKRSGASGGAGVGLKSSFGVWRRFVDVLIAISNASMVGAATTTIAPTAVLSHDWL